jgi:hypothetical protein
LLNKIVGCEGVCANIYFASAMTFFKKDMISSSHNMMDLLAPTLHADATLVSNIKRRLATPGCPALLADMATVA